jgi:hypothetical protein
MNVFNIKVMVLWGMLVFALLATLAMLATPVQADDVSELKMMVEQLRSDYESKIRTLEVKIAELEKTQEQKVNEKVANLSDQIKQEIKDETMNVEYVGRHNAPVGAGGLVVENPFGFGNVSLGGYMDTEYRDLDGAESTFNQHRWIINIGAEVTDRVRFNSEYEIEYGGTDSPGGDGEAKVEQAYIDYLVNEMINLRAGALLVPFGRYNLYHDSDLQDLTDRPIVARDVIPTTWTEAGYGFFGEFNPTLGSYEDLILNYEIYAVNGLDNGFSDTGLSGAKSSLKTDNNDNKAVVGRLVASPLLGHEVGVSGYWGEYNGNENAISGIGFDTLNTFGPLEVLSEYAYFGVEETPTASSDLANYFQGAYVQLNYHFWPEFFNETFLGRKFEHPTFTLVGRYDWAEIHDDGDAGSDPNEEQRYTLGFNYRPIDSFVVKFEYQFNDKTNEALEAGDSDGFITSVALGF